MVFENANPKRNSAWPFVVVEGLDGTGELRKIMNDLFILICQMLYVAYIISVY